MAHKSKRKIKVLGESKSLPSSCSDMGGTFSDIAHRLCGRSGSHDPSDLEAGKYENINLITTESAHGTDDTPSLDTISTSFNSNSQKWHNGSVAPVPKPRNRTKSPKDLTQKDHLLPDDTQNSYGSTSKHDTEVSLTISQNPSSLTPVTVVPLQVDTTESLVHSITNDQIIGQASNNDTTSLTTASASLGYGGSPFSFQIDSNQEVPNAESSVSSSHLPISEQYPQQAHFGHKHISGQEISDHEPTSGQPTSDHEFTSEQQTSYHESTSEQQKSGHECNSGQPKIVERRQTSGYESASVHESISGYHYRGDYLPVPSGVYYSYATLENARYSVDQPPRPDHVNDDRAFVINREGRATVLAVFDGHDGNKASSFVDDYMYRLFNSDDTLNQLEHSDVHTVLTNVFLNTEQAFFNKLQPFITEKERIQRTIPKVKSSFSCSFDVVSF